MVALALALVASSTPTATVVLRECQAAYDALASLRIDARGTIDNLYGTAHIVFQRPGKLKITGKSMFGTSYSLVSVGNQTWVTSRGKREQLRKSLLTGVESVSGLSLSSATVTPVMLFHLAYANGMKVVSATSKVRSDRLNGRSAYAVEIDHPNGYSDTFWIDKKSHLLLKKRSIYGKATGIVTFSNIKPNAKVSAHDFKR